MKGWSLQPIPFHVMEITSVSCYKVETVELEIPIPHVCAEFSFKERCLWLYICRIVL